MLDIAKHDMDHLKVKPHEVNKGSIAHQKGWNFSF
jgi:hypothetical protein